MAETLSQWNRFLDGISSEGPISSVILESWRRSEAAGVERAPENVEFVRVADEELQRRLEANADWLAIARPHLEWLTTTFSHVPHVIYLTDREGIVLDSVGSRDFIETFGLSPGHDWSESRMGTNGAGTALAAGQPVAVIGSAHFISAFHDCTCTGAPIHAPDGSLIGAIDISTCVADGSPERLSIVAHAAYAIGREVTYERQEESLRQAEQSLRESEARLRAILDNTAAFVYLMDSDNRFLHINRHWNEVFDLTNEKVAGRSIYEVFPRRIANQFRDNNRKVFETGQPLKTEEVIPMEDGLHTYITAKVPICDPSGKPYAICGISTDITDLKRIEREREQALERLRKKNDRLRLLSDAAEVLLHAEDPNAMLPSLFDMIGPHLGLDAYFHFKVDDRGEALHLASCIGIPDATAQGLSRLEFGQAICGTAALERQSIVANHIQQSDDAKAQLVKSWGIRAYACHPLMVGDELLGTLSFGTRSRDEFAQEELDFLKTIGHYVIAAYERVRFIKQLQEADRRKDEFLAMLAHELRNPLAPIRSGLDILAMEPGHDHETVALMQDQVEHVVRLVDDLLDVSRIMQGKVELRREPVDLAALIKRSVEAVRSLVDGQGQELTARMPAQPLWLCADAVRLVQVIENLLNNASKYTDAGGRIELIAERQDDRAVISVRDTGIGIEPELLPNVFELFTQSSRSLDRAQGGLGIGLTLVKRLVEMHGGTVCVHSEGSGRGSTFTVCLPLTEDSPSAEQKVKEGPLVQRHRILVVDDNLGAARMLTMLLQKLNDHEIETAHDGPSALAKFQAMRPDIVLLDIGLPGMDGYEVGRCIRESSIHDGILLVALTGYGQEEDRLKTKEAGFDEHLVKPPSVEQIQAILAHPKLAK